MSCTRARAGSTGNVEALRSCWCFCARCDLHRDDVPTTAVLKGEETLSSVLRLLGCAEVQVGQLKARAKKEGAVAEATVVMYDILQMVVESRRGVGKRSA